MSTESDIIRLSKSGSYKRYSIGYHSTRINAMFEYIGVKLDRETLSLYADIYDDLSKLYDKSILIEHRDLLVMLIERDIDNGIIS